MNTLSAHRLGMLMIIIAIPAIVFMAAVIHYSINIPLYDDITQILWVTNTFIEGHMSPGTPEMVYRIANRMHAIFYPNAGHVPMVTRLFALAQYYLTGHVNFYAATIICCLIWVVTALLLLKKFHLDGTPTEAILVAPFLLFSLSQWESMTMMLGGIQMYIGTLFFPLMTLYAVSTRKPVLAGISFFFGLFSSAGALCLLPLGGIYFLLRRQWKPFIIFMGISLLFVPVFYELNVFGRDKDPIGALLTNIPGHITYILYFLSNLTASGSTALELLGSMTKINLFLGAALAGVGLLCLFATSGHHFAKLIIVYIFLLALMTSIKRTDIAPRYGIFALIYATTVYAVLSTWYYQRLKPDVSTYLNSVVLILVMVLWANNAVMAVKPLNFYRELRIQDMQDYIRTGDAKNLMWDPAWCSDILNVSRRLGVYDYQNINEPVMLPGIRKLL